MSELSKPKRKYYLKRTPLRKKSNHPSSVLIRECDDLLLKVLLRERGLKCEICGKTHGTGQLGKFHILPKGQYPKIRFSKSNVLIVGWTCCHDNWHSDYYKGREIEKRIKQLRGDDYEEKLKILDKTMPVLNTFRLSLVKVALTQELGE